MGSGLYFDILIEFLFISYHNEYLKYNKKFQISQFCVRDEYIGNTPAVFNGVS